MKYYYKNKNTNRLAYCLNNPIEQYSQINFKNYVKISEDEWYNILSEMNKQSDIFDQISALKSDLASTDYQAIKFAEGELTEEEYSPIKLQRKEWREAINLLESKLL